VTFSRGSSHEKSGRVGYVGRGCCKDVRNKLCSWTLENNIDTWTNGQHNTAADRRLTNQVSAWHVGRGSRRTCPTRMICYGLVTDILARMSRGCYEENGPVEFKLIGVCCVCAIPRMNLRSPRQLMRIATVLIIYASRNRRPVLDHFCFRY